MNDDTKPAEEATEKPAAKPAEIETFGCAPGEVCTDEQHPEVAIPEPISHEFLRSLKEGLYRFYNRAGGFDLVLINFSSANPLKEGKRTRRTASIYGSDPEKLYWVGEGHDSFPVSSYHRIERAELHSIRFVAVADESTS